MARELGGSQISALLESVPGIASVLRSPVADALVGMIRAGAGLESFRLEHARELVEYAVRRGLIGAGEGEQLMEAVQASGRVRPAAARSSKRKAARPVRKPAAKRKGGPVKKAAKRSPTRRTKRR